jgi:hypothetical protein
MRLVLPGGAVLCGDDRVVASRPLAGIAEGRMMRTFPCPDCGKQVSVKATECPYCDCLVDSIELPTEPAEPG